MNARNSVQDRLLWCLLFAVGLGVAAFASWPQSHPHDSLSAIAPFRLTDRSRRLISNEDLKGSVWIAGCTFTCCTLSCPKINEALARLSHELQHTDVYLVNFTVDPDHDTPQVLAQYADVLGADSRRWLFLTGSTEEIYPVIEASFLTRPQVNADPKAAPGVRVSHSNRLFLVDKKGNVRDSYACVENELNPQGEPTDTFRINDETLRRLARDAERLDQGPLAPFLCARWLPPVNAALNATSAILLMMGYTLIRRGRVLAHMRCMLGAVSVSTLFLLSYLYYHALHGSTAFGGSGWVRPVYFSILISHTVLAAVVAPMVIATLYLALRRRFDRHLRLARWTLPIWLYVSVTGVLVYVFLYHFFPP
jgi:protein SCO1/2/putative membrane protein